MRLIDADRLYDALADKLLWLMQYGDDTYLSVGDDIRKTIADQPTAYDIDKVVEQLEKYRGNFESRGILPLVNMDYAVEVVRNGGKDQE